MAQVQNLLKVRKKERKKKGKKEGRKKEKCPF